MMDGNQKKAERAAAALRAVGIKSAEATHTGRVTLSPEDSMKMLLLTQEDGLKLIEMEQRVRRGIKSEVCALQERLARLAKLANHSADLCKKGKHILDSYATGGRDGHVSTNCLACDHHVDGYD